MVLVVLKLRAECCFNQIKEIEGTFNKELSQIRLVEDPAAVAQKYRMAWCLAVMEIAVVLVSVTFFEPREIDAVMLLNVLLLHRLLSSTDDPALTTDQPLFSVTDVQEYLSAIGQGTLPALPLLHPVLRIGVPSSGGDAINVQTNSQVEIGYDDTISFDELPQSMRDELLAQANGDIEKMRLGRYRTKQVATRSTGGQAPRMQINSKSSVKPPP
ncbi:hypothetical protein BJ742DRAFT_776727 [Cladochytrium replicatum]|nr:hypothetical protein BJ742DRAFT_776727 [Cladochytrium replicatum]